MTTTWTAKKISRGVYLMTKHRRGRADGVAALLTVEPRGSGAVAQFVATDAHRAHAVAEAARCYAQLCDTLGDLVSCGDVASEGDFFEQVRLNSCKGGSLGRDLGDPHQLGASVEVDSDNLLPLAVYFGDDLVELLGAEGWL